MQTMISILLLISITCGSLYYLYSENGPVQQWEKEDNDAYEKALKSVQKTKEIDTSK